MELHVGWQLGVRRYGCEVSSEDTDIWLRSGRGSCWRNNSRELVQVWGIKVPSGSAEWAQRCHCEKLKHSDSEFEGRDVGVVFVRRQLIQGEVSNVLSLSAPLLGKGLGNNWELEGSWWPIPYWGQLHPTPSSFKILHKKSSSLLKLRSSNQISEKSMSWNFYSFLE